MLVGETLEGRYRMVRFIGSGTFSQVYEAEEMVLDHPIGRCAVKLIRAYDQSQIGDAVRELQTLARLPVHPRIVAFRGAGSVASGPAEGCILVALELAGMSLEQRLREGPMALDEVCRMVGDLAQALAHLHRLNVVHRDVKPANLYLAGDHWKLGDLGLARLLEHNASQASGVRGTLLYLAPETLGGKTGAAVDIWALGAVAQEALTGRLPFGVREVDKLIFRLLHDPPTIAPDLPPPFDELIPACLDRTPQARPTAAQVLQSLESRAGLP